MKQVLLIFLLLYLQQGIFAQNSSKVDEVKIMKLKEVLKQIEKQFDVNFSFSDEIIKDKEVILPDFSSSLSDILFSLNLQTGIDFNHIDSHYIYLVQGKINHLNKVIITGYITKGIYKNSDGSYGFKPDKFGLLPGLTDNDVLASLQFLPGVASPDNSVGNITVHGGNTDENGILWDGIRIYHSGHLFGMISPFNPYVADKVRFIYKATDVEFHDFASGIIDINTKQKITNTWHFQGGFNGLSADAIVDIPIIKNKMSLQTSFRRSYEDVLETKTFTKYEAQAFQNTKIRDEKFHFKDYHFKLNFQPDKKHYIGISSIHIDNDLENNLTDNLNNTFYDFLDTENDGISLNWNYKLSNNKQWNTLATYSKYYFINIYKTNYTDSQVSTFTKENSIKNASVKSVYSIKNKNRFWKIGLETDYKHLSYDFREEKHITYILNQDNNKLITQSLFGMYQWKKDKKWDISTGLRMNYYTDLQKSVLEPRIRINRYLNKNMQMQFSAEHKHQPVTQIRQTILSDFYVQQKIWRLADEKKYPVLSSNQYTLGLVYQQQKFHFDADFYYKHTRGITGYSLGFLNPDDPVLHKGEQKAFGIDLFAKRKWKHISIQTSYSYMFAQRQFDGINNSNWFISDNQIKHNFTLMSAYSNNNFDISAGVKIRSGLPFTELELEEDNDDDIDEDFYEFDGINSEELPLYYKLNLSAKYHFNLSKNNKVKANIGFSLKNVTNNRVQTGIYYTGNNSLNDEIRIIKYYSVGIIPNFSFRVKF